MTTEIILSCKKCGTSFSVFGNKNIKTFCSRKCANSRTWTEEDKNKKSVALKNSSKAKLVAQKQIVPKTEKICSCGKSFFVLPCKMRQQYCSTRCSDQYKIKAGGGYRERSGRSKSGYYKGIYCGSTYELCWVIYSLDHNVPFQRFPGYIANEQIKYYPDFLLNEKQIIEIKGYENKEKVQAKCELAKEKGFNIKVLYKNDLKTHFEYVKLKYKTDKFYILYDDYKPSYVYECSFCKKNFNRDKQTKTKNVLCSKICSMKFNRLLLAGSID